MNNKGCFHAMFVECLENAFSSCDTVVPSTISPSTSPYSPPILDDNVVIPPIANLCVTSDIPNSDVRHDLYDHCLNKFPSPLAFVTVDFQSAALVLMISLYNALLDSGCTHHIVQDHALFLTYLEKPVSVGTANCGSLEALGTGNVEFRYPFGN